MMAAGGVRQFRALMLRLKPLAQEGLGANHTEFARRLDIRPRKPTHSPLRAADWWEARIGRIAAQFRIVAEFNESPHAIVYSEQIIMTEKQARATFQDLFGHSESHHSPTGKGWWMTYSPSGANALSLIATFDSPKKNEAFRAIFSAAILKQK
jgi:hypothetical protein